MMTERVADEITESADGAERNGRYQFIDWATQGYLLGVGMLILLFHNATVPLWPWLLLSHAAAMVAVHLAIRGHGWYAGNWALDFLRHFYPVMLYTGFYCETSKLNRMFFSDYLDPIFIGIEKAVFGGQPALAFMNQFPYLPVSELFYASYYSYYIMIIGVGLALYFRNRSAFFHYVSVTSFIFYICYLIYIFLPVIGPRVFFPQFPGYDGPAALDWQAPYPPPTFPENITGGMFFQIMKVVYARFGAVGAAFPSSHVAIAVCTVYFSFRYLRRIRWAHALLASLLCMATVYCRYHYAIDVLAGLVTVGLLLPLANKLYFAGNPNRGECQGSSGETTPYQSHQ